ncbi:MAG: hypothetical protein FWC36_09600 [Spirochaetes bacterium]|nr:hypothetical protein [Spirochaetota bacterium]
MVENIKDAALADYSVQPPVKTQKTQPIDPGINHRDLKGILFLGIRGDINIEIDGNKNKLDILA